MAIFLSFIAGIITTTILYVLLNSIWLKSVRRELARKIEQAEKVKKDLDDLMQSSLELSQSLVQDLESNLERQYKLANEAMIAEAQSFPPTTAYNANRELRNEAANQRGLNWRKVLSAYAEDITDSISRADTPDDNKRIKRDTPPDDFLSLQTIHPYIAVKTLLERGYSAKQIAQELNRGQGEINLIINLLNKKDGLAGG